MVTQWAGERPDLLGQCRFLDPAGRGGERGDRAPAPRGRGRRLPRGRGTPRRPRGRLRRAGRLSAANRRRSRSPTARPVRGSRCSTPCRLPAGDRILSPRSSTRATRCRLLRRAEETGATIEMVPSDAHGQVDVDALAPAGRAGQAGVAGARPDQRRPGQPGRTGVAEAAHEVGALVLLDACQSAGQLDVCADSTWTCSSAPAASGCVDHAARASWWCGARCAAGCGPGRSTCTAGQWVAPDRYELRDDARVFELWESASPTGSA